MQPSSVPAAQGVCGHPGVLRSRAGGRLLMVWDWCCEGLGAGFWWSILLGAQGDTAWGNVNIGS